MKCHCFVVVVVGGGGGCWLVDYFVGSVTDYRTVESACK